MCHHAPLCMSWALNSGPHTCLASTLLTEPSPQPQDAILALHLFHFHCCPLDYYSMIHFSILLATDGFVSSLVLL